MATPSPTGPSEEDDWDDYLHGMFKKLKMDPEKLKDASTKCGTSSSRQGSRWYNQTVKPPKKTRKSLALRSSRNRQSPYKSLLTCHGGKATCESPLIRSSTLSVPSEQGNRLAHGKMWSDTGNVKVKFATGVEKCSCSKQETSCTCNTKTDGSLCKCGKKISACQIGSMCKSKLLTFRTLATIVEESGEVSMKEKRSEKKLAQNPCKDGATCTGDVTSKKNGATGASPLLHFSNYRSDDTAGFKFSPEIPLPAPPTTTFHTAQSSNRRVGTTGRTSNTPCRVPVRLEYSCSQEARMTLDDLPDDTSVDDLAGYFDSIVYIPRNMSAMAEMMYT